MHHFGQTEEVLFWGFSCFFLFLSLVYYCYTSKDPDIPGHNRMRKKNPRKATKSHKENLTLLGFQPSVVMECFLFVVYDQVVWEREGMSWAS